MTKTASDYLGLGFFIHPVPALAVLMMALNDHYLKYHFSSWWTGKLSDFAGLFFFPLFLCAIYVLISNSKRRRFWIHRAMVLTAIILADTVFISVKMIPQITRIYEETLGQIGFPSRVTPDPTDLIALSMNSLTYIYARQFWRS